MRRAGQGSWHERRAIWCFPLTDIHDMKFLHFGDIHVWRLRLAGDFWYPKRVLGTVNLSLRRRLKFPQAYPQIVAAEIMRQEADAVIFSGDMTTMSLRPEFVEAARLFAPIREKWGDSFFCIPGNHDRYSPGSNRRGMYEEYFPYGAFPKGRLVRSHLLKDGLSVVGFDCSHPCRIRSNGTITPLLEEQLRGELEEQKEAGNKVILTGHYPLTYPSDVHAAWEHKLLQAGRLARLVDEFQPVLYLHGHKHQRWAVRASERARTLCVNCGAAGMVSSEESKQAGFVTIKIDDESYEPEAVTAHVLRRDSSLEFSTHHLALPE